MMEIVMAREPDPRYFSGMAGDALHPETTGTLADMELDPDPIKENWILSGNPRARSKTLAVSPDGASQSVVWDCMAGTFYWHYRHDEAVLFISGEAYLIEKNGQEHRFAAGDFAFFPARTVAKWRVDHYVRKIAFLREPVWSVAVPLIMLWNKIMRKLRPSRESGWTHLSGQR